MAHILICTNPTDEHAFVVGEAVRRKGGEADLLFTADFPRQLLLTMGHDGSWFQEWDGPGMTDFVLEPTAAWHRRPRGPVLADWIDDADRKHAQREAFALQDAFMAMLAPRAFWVNPYPARDLAAMKPLQLRRAVAVGLPVPATLFSNDPGRIRTFVAQHQDVVFKAFTQTGFWRQQQHEQNYALFTSPLTPEHLADDEVLAASPGIYQRRVPKQHELRVTMVGTHAIAVKILSQDTSHGRLDWRVAYDELRMEAVELPDPVLGACRRLMADLGLVFGCIDLIVTPSGEHVFLEINEMGQFLFVEHYAGVPVLDAFCELLIQGRPDFAWDPGKATVRFPELQAEATAQQQQAIAQHVVPPNIYPVVEDPPVQLKARGAAPAE